MDYIAGGDSRSSGFVVTHGRMQLSKPGYHQIALALKKQAFTVRKYTLTFKKRVFTVGQKYISRFCGQPISGMDNFRHPSPDLGHLTSDFLNYAGSPKTDARSLFYS